MIAGRRRGAVSVEVVLLVPVVLMFVFALVACWRVWTARTAVMAAAEAGARAASLESSRHVADAQARRVARDDLSSGAPCAGTSVDVDTSQFVRPPGAKAEVYVTATCTVALNDVLFPGLPGHFTVQGSATEQLDTFRERRP